MCLIAFALGQNRSFPLVLAANRDEFFQRPTAAMDEWRTGTGDTVLAGRDLKSGGTWLALTPAGDIAAVTNVREGAAEAGRRSRGELPLRALHESRARLWQRLADEGRQYAGFNLIRLSADSGWYYSNRDAHPGRWLHRGVFGLSNHLLQTPWPKLLRLRTALARAVPDAGHDAWALHQRLLELLQDTTPAPDHALPDTGVGLETERFLSSPFIVGPEYGTRTTTIVTLAASGDIRVTEQTWHPMAQPGPQRRFHWQL
jgi:uncharacterized protein with NRDE domain